MLLSWKANVGEIEKFVREKRIMTLPDPLTLVVGQAPPYLLARVSEGSERENSQRPMSKSDKTATRSIGFL